MKLTRETMALSLGLAGILGLGFGFLVVPQYRAGVALNTEIAKMQVEAGKPSDGPEVIASLSKDLEALRVRGEARMTPIPEQSDIAGLMRDLSATLDSLGLDKRELVQGNTKQLEEASLIPMSVILEGEFPKIYATARYLESLPRLVRVQRLRIALPGAGRDSIDRTGVVQGELMIDVFFQPKAIAGQTSASASTVPEGVR